MPFYTVSEARAAATRRVVVAKSDHQVLSEARAAVKAGDHFDVFLSHSLKDATLVRGVMLLLEQQGLSVYVDWMVDAQLNRLAVTTETADILRVRMRQCSSLLYLATANSPYSKWMPWELGYFDGFRPNSVGILPLVEKDTDSFERQEYLGLYPVVRRTDSSLSQPAAFLQKSDGAWTMLRAFAQGAAKWQR